jgi:hypothetical protein
MYSQSYCNQVHFLSDFHHLNLGIKTLLNVTLTSNIVVDKTEAATDTVDYVATDTAALTATSTRTVLIEAAAATSTAQ